MRISLRCCQGLVCRMQNGHWTAKSIHCPMQASRHPPGVKAVTHSPEKEPIVLQRLTQETPRSSCDAENAQSSPHLNTASVDLLNILCHFVVKKRGGTVGKIFTIVEFTIKKAARARCLVGQPTIVMEQVKRLFKVTLILIM